MLTLEVLTEAGWEQANMPADAPQEGVSTEFNLQRHPAWDQSLHALMDELEAASLSADNDNPSRNAIISAGNILAGLREKTPFFPPTLIIKEPCGGIIIEWQITNPVGDKYLQELTVYNDCRVEIIVFKNGKVIDMQSGMPLERTTRR